MDQALTQMKQLLAQALRDTDGAVQVGDDDDIVNDLGLDSLQMIRFLLDVEVRFGVALDFAQIDIERLGSVRGFTAYITGQMQGPGSG